MCKARAFVQTHANRDKESGVYDADARRKEKTPAMTGVKVCTD